MKKAVVTLMLMCVFVSAAFFYAPVNAATGTYHGDNYDLVLDWSSAVETISEYGGSTKYHYPYLITGRLINNSSSSFVVGSTSTILIKITRSGTGISNDVGNGVISSTNCSINATKPSTYVWNINVTPENMLVLAPGEEYFFSFVWYFDNYGNTPGSVGFTVTLPSSTLMSPSAFYDVDSSLGAGSVKSVSYYHPEYALSLYAQYRIMPPVYVTADYEMFGDEVTPVLGTKRYYAYLYLFEQNTSSDQYSVINNVDVSSIILGSYYPIVDRIFSPVNDSYGFASSTFRIFKSQHLNNRFIFPANKSYTTVINMHFDVPADVNINFPASISFSDAPFGNVRIDNDTYLAPDIYSQVRDIYLYLTENNQPIIDQSEDVNDGSETIESQMIAIETQEAQYFSDNSAAIEAIGLNNFNFNPNSISAFSMITTQFSELWNALSDYTLVFIFTLLLSLATYIIRHEPTTKVKQYRSSVAAERAERISYYGKKNAQARAMQSGHDAEFWDAVRRLNR